MKNYAVLLFATILSFSCMAQNTFEVSAAAGYTAVDLDALVEKDEVSGSYVTDWNQLSAGIGVQYFYAASENIGYGAELMYHHLYWYSVRIPFGTQVIYRDYSVTAFRITPIVRFGINSAVSIDIGPELNFSDGLEVGLMLAGGYNISLSDRLTVPLKLRLDIMNSTVITLPVTINAGLRFKL
ncbi:MAG: hypothetical protein RIB71_17360 [Imperialibacter sp.]|uniref:hypothetical protein n=1 Tax=Imperialibacter sp. TaxID=2038411 RepID=UPI0032EDCD6F